MPISNAVDATVQGFQSLNTSTGVWNGRTLQPGTGISITNGDGTGGDPTISATGSVNPSAMFSLYEDFISADLTAGNKVVSNYLWEAANFQSFPLTDNGHPGIIASQSVSTATALLILSQSAVNSTNCIVLGGGALQFNFVIKIAALSVANPRYILICGLQDTATGKGCYVTYTDNVNSGQWQYVTKDGATTTTSSSVAVTTGWHNVGITVNAAATSVAFTIDGVSLGAANTTNITTSVGICPSLSIQNTVGTTAANNLIADAMWLNQTLTVAR